MRPIRREAARESPAATLMFRRGCGAPPGSSLYSAVGRAVTAFRLNDHLVDPSLNRITTPAGDTVQVEPKIMHVLTTLAERPQEVVSREQLMQRVWSGVFVTDDVLHRAIRELRRLFDDDAESPRVIETIRKRGYRLIG